MLHEPKYTLTGGVASIEALLKKYAGPNDLVRVDLGCGYYKPAGFIGIDNLSGAESQVENRDNTPDLLMDLNNDPIPFPDACCKEIRSSHYLEHSNLQHVFLESHRLLAPRECFRFTVPYANSAEGLYPGHAIFLTEKWFQENITFQRLFNRQHRAQSLAGLRAAAGVSEAAVPL